MKHLFYFLFALVILSCSANSKEGAPAIDMSKSEANYQTEDVLGTQGVDTPIESQKKIIKTANIKVKVEDVDSVSSLLENEILKLGGYISTMEMNNSNFRFQNSIKFKINPTHFSKFIRIITNSSEFIDYKNIHTKDVTEEYVDLQSRLETKKEVKKHFEDILRGKATTVEEVLMSENEIRIIQEEIEAKEGRLNYLGTQVSLSTINLVLYQKVEYQTKPVTLDESFSIRSTEGFQNGWEIVTTFTIILINIWPLILLILVAIVFRKKMKSFFLNSRKKK